MNHDAALAKTVEFIMRNWVNPRSGDAVYNLRNLLDTAIAKYLMEIKK